MTGCSKPKAPEIPPPVVQSLVVTATNVQAHVETIGQLDSPQNVEIRARVEGFVEKIHFADGAEVKDGDLLFTLDAKPFQEKLAAAEGTLAEARASLNKYQRDVARLRPLAEKRAIPQQDLENASAAVEVGKASVLSAEARVASAKLDLGYCQLHSPVSGLIGAAQATVGSLVGRGQPTLLATISQLDPIWFYCAISEVDYLKAERKALESGRRIADIPATLILSDGTELPDLGKWVFIDRAVDATTGTLRARAEFANTNKLLRPGMFARVRVPLQNTKPSVVIPQRAIQELQGRNFVWVLSGGDNESPSISSQRPVRIGSRVGSNCAIEEGLQPGERIIVEGLNKVREGAPVTALTAEQFAARAKAAASGNTGNTGTGAASGEGAKAKTTAKE
jgi:membrane fusion protein (multidrug efflux system)